MSGPASQSAEYVRRKATISMSFHQFQLPPIRDALVIGRRAPVGANGVARAFHEMVPGTFRLIQVEHPTIEAILVRESALRKLPEKELVPRILSHAERIMDEEDALHVSVDIEVLVEEEGIELP